MKGSRLELGKLTLNRGLSKRENRKGISGNAKESRFDRIVAISLEKESAKLLHNSFADSARRVILQHEATVLFSFSLVFL